MLVIFDMPTLESAQGRVQRELGVSREGLEGWARRMLQFFHFQSLPGLSDHDPGGREVSIVLGLESALCIPVYRMPRTEHRRLPVIVS